MAKWIVEKLNPKQHQREDFDCGVEVLNAYLKTRANQEQKKRLNVTYVVVADEVKSPKPILGFYTLTNSSMVLYFVEPVLRRHIPPNYDIPTLKIGRLALAKDLQGQGIGKFMLKDACDRLIEMSVISGIKGLEVVAKNEVVANFYKSFGFCRLIDNKNTLFLPIETILSA
ncbi:MAG: GNAT family N-acetyltransferase [Gammaproteobacteria bacterium]|nr:GNAT family N-acetyltransferase [Gammaproteobacteria bacterium]